MDSNGDNSHFTKRVTLPSGKTIEVVYFTDDVHPSGAEAPAHAPALRPYGSETLGSHYQGQVAATESRYEGRPSVR